MNAEDEAYAKLYWEKLVAELLPEGCFNENAPEINQSVEVPPGGWLKFGRTTLQRSSMQLSQRLKVSRQVYLRFEEHESNGKLNLANLKSAAEALDCELIYFLKPKSAATFSAKLWQDILPAASATFDQRMRARGNATVGSQFRSLVLARIAAKLLRDPKFRRKMGWVRYTTSKS